MRQRKLMNQINVVPLGRNKRGMAPLVNPPTSDQLATI